MLLNEAPAVRPVRLQVVCFRAHSVRRIARGGVGLLRKYLRSIRVEDASGAQFELHELVDRGWIRTRRIFELDTGERALRVDDNTFALVSTGERFVRIT